MNPEWTYVPEGAFARSWFFLRRVWALFRGDWSLIAVAAVSALLNALAAALLFGGATLLDGVDPRLKIALTCTLLALPVTVASTYCGVALLTLAQARFAGERRTAREGFRAANGRLGAILGWSLIAVGVGALLRLLADRLPFGGALVAWVGGVAWSLATMFAVPVLAVEDVSPVRAGRRSVEVFRARWGDGLAGTITVTALTMLVSVPALIAIVIGVQVGGAAGLALVAAGAVGFAVARTGSEVGQQLFALALYRHQIMGEPSFDLRPEQLDSLVRLKPYKKR
jgi:hypothetical protein